jgi:hypothetical protein
MIIRLGQDVVPLLADRLLCRLHAFVCDGFVVMTRRLDHFDDHSLQIWFMISEGGAFIFLRQQAALHRFFNSADLISFWVGPYVT